MPVIGKAKILANIDAQYRKKVLAFGAGVAEGGLLIQRESQLIVPVDYGNLKASAFTRVNGKGTARVVVTVGYTAAYAVFVHENLDAAHGAVFNAKYAAELAHAAELRRKKLGGTTGPFRHDRGANQQAKFLEKPFRDKHRDVFNIVVARVRAAK